MTQASTNPNREQKLAAAEEQYHKALDLVAVGEPCAAVEGFLSCIALDPEKLDAVHGLVRALQDCGRLDDGIEWAKKLIDLDPSDPLAHTSLSMFYQAQGKIEEAEKEGNVAKVLGWKQELRKNPT